jgi:methyltransferase (TIGR00027 family)
MQPGKASFTARSTAAARAAHLLVHGGPPIFADTFAFALSGIASVEQLRASAAGWGAADAARASAFFALRHRYAEDRLQLALDRGVGQIVLLGAGLDSLALRRPDLTDRVSLYEVDHPDSQRWKLARIAELGLATPGVHYVPLDFQSERLEVRLVESGVRLGEGIFFSWLGVAQYVDRAVVDEMFAFVAARPPGSELVFDAILADDLLAPDERIFNEVAAEGSAARGEPWISRFDPRALETQLVAAGFSRVERLTPELAAERYYGGQPAGVAPLHAWQMLAATV